MEEKKLYKATTQMTPAIYKNFYKIYYKEKMKIANVIMFVIGIAVIAGGIYMYNTGQPLLWTVIALWIGIFLIVYPKMMYRKPYKKVKDNSQTTHFSFYENYMTEKINSEKTTYYYSDLQKIIETKKYFLIFHNPESVSIVDKEKLSCDSKTIASFLKTKTEYKVSKS